MRRSFDFISGDDLMQSPNGFGHWPSLGPFTSGECLRGKACYTVCARIPDAMFAMLWPRLTYSNDRPTLMETIDAVQIRAWERFGRALLGEEKR